MGRMLRAVLVVAVLLGAAVAAHQGLVTVAAGGGERPGGPARFAAGTCATCHGGGPVAPGGR